MTVYSPEPREAASSDSARMASRPSFADAVDPLVGVDLEHLLGGVLRAIEPLPLQRRQLLHGGPRRHQREGHGHGRRRARSG